MAQRGASQPAAKFWPFMKGLADIISNDARCHPCCLAGETRDVDHAGTGRRLSLSAHWRPAGGSGHSHGVGLLGLESPCPCHKPPSL